MVDVRGRRRPSTLSCTPSRSLLALPFPPRSRKRCGPDCTALRYHSVLLHPPSLPTSRPPLRPLRVLPFLLLVSRPNPLRYCTDTKHRPWLSAKQQQLQQFQLRPQKPTARICQRSASPCPLLFSPRLFLLGSLYKASGFSGCFFSLVRGSADARAETRCSLACVHSPSNNPPTRTTSL